MSKDRVLLFIKTPPPTTGATLMNQRVHESELLRNEFDIRSICISYMQSRKDMGKFQLKKIGIIFSTVIKLIFELIFQRPALVYFQLSPTGIAFYRDVIYVTIIKFLRVNLIFHLHGKGIKARVKKNLFDKFLYRFAFKNSQIICLSKLLDSDIEDVHFGETFYVSNGIPDNDFLCIKRTGVKDSLNLLFLSNLIQDKGVLDFLEALRILHSKKISFKATIVGAEADLTEKELNKMIISFGIENKVSYLGAKYGEEKSEILFKNHILVFPTKIDIFGIVNLEAMQHGLAVVSTNISAIPDIIDNEITGFLVEPDSPKKIAEKLEILINDPEKCIEMGKNGRRKYEKKYTLEEFEENLVKVFKKAI